MKTAKHLDKYVGKQVRLNLPEHELHGASGESFAAEEKSGIAFVYVDIHDHILLVRASNLLFEN